MLLEYKGSAWVPANVITRAPHGCRRMSLQGLRMGAGECNYKGSAWVPSDRKIYLSVITLVSLPLITTVSALAHVSISDTMRT